MRCLRHCSSCLRGAYVDYPYAIGLRKLTRLGARGFAYACLLWHNSFNSHKGRSWKMITWNDHRRQTWPISGLGCFLVGNSFPSDSKNTQDSKSPATLYCDWFEPNSWMFFPAEKKEKPPTFWELVDQLSSWRRVGFFVFRVTLKERKSTKMVKHQTKLNHQFINERHILGISNVPLHERNWPRNQNWRDDLRHIPPLDSLMGPWSIVKSDQIAFSRIPRTNLFGCFQLSD